MSKRIKVFSIISLTAIVIAGAFIQAQTRETVDLKATDNNYQISFNSSNNKFHSYTGNVAYDGAATIKTDLGNDVAFNYYQIKGIASTWHVLGAGGYFYNTDPIRGIESIDLSFKTNDGSYTIYYSGDLSFDQHKDFMSSSLEHTTFDFENTSPNYFKVVNTSGSNLNIFSISIELSCLNQHPTITVLSEDETMGTVTGGGVKNAGQTTTITATPNDGYRFVGWYSDSTLVSTNPTFEFVVNYDDLVYTAKFTYQSYNFVVESESNEKGTVSDSNGEYNYLSIITITAFANNGYTFIGWYDGLNLVSTNNPFTFEMPYENTTYIAKFETNTYELLITNNNPDLGSVSGAGSYLYNSNTTVIATPNTGVSFLGWYNSDDEQVSTYLQYSFDMPFYDYELIAKFAWTPYSVTITINDSTMGSISGSGSYIYNQEVTLVAIPNEHHSFVGWYDGDELISSNSEYTFNMPEGSLSYDARFVKNYNLFVYSDDETKGSVTAPFEWGEGLEVSVMANPAENYALNYWYDDDLNEVSYDASYTFVMPDHDVTLYASFSEGYTLTVLSEDTTKGTVSGGGRYVVGRVINVVVNSIFGTFKGWYDDNGQFVSKNNPYVLVMPSSNYYLEARFMTQTEEEELGIQPVVSSDGKTITFGMYPQTNVDDPLVIDILNTLTNQDSNGWYFYNDEYYAKVRATPYRTNDIFDNGTIISSGTTYWFKCEPIVWNVLNNNNNSYYYVVASMVLDVCCYYNSKTDRQKGMYTIYPNNYEYSDIRTWLNNDFYNSAFALGNERIITRTVDNSPATTDGSTNPYACANTQEKISLLSYKDYCQSSYGFSSGIDAASSRYCKPTDWAKANGLFYYKASTYPHCKNNCNYWTRSPHRLYSYEVCCVNFQGALRDNNVSVVNNCGVRPAILIDIT